MGKNTQPTISGQDARDPRDFSNTLTEILTFSTHRQRYNTNEMSVSRTTTGSKPKRRRRLTEADLLSLPDTGRKYELVNGRLQEVPTGGRHGWLEHRLYSRIAPYIPQQMVSFGSSTGFRMAQGNIRSPDLSVMDRERLPGGEPPVGFIDGAPDLAVEIVSPSENLANLHDKLREYFEAGAKEVWLLFPETQQVYRYTGLLQVEVLGADDLLRSETLLPGFEVRVRELFE